MSANWWQADPEADGLMRGENGEAPDSSASSPPHPLTPSPHQSLPPAILLRLPPAFRAAAARRLATSRDASPGHLECGAGFTIGTPVSQYGAVKLWRAKSVDLQALRVAALQGQVVALHAEDIDVIGKAFEDVAVEVEFEVELALVRVAGQCAAGGSRLGALVGLLPLVCHGFPLLNRARRC